MVFVLGRNSCVFHKVVSRFIQGPIAYPKIMGASSSRSYSPNSAQGGSNENEKRAVISRMESTTDYVEAIVCKANDLKDNEMKVFDIGEEGKVLLVKQNGVFSAIGPDCTHYGAPLVKGALGNGRVRCPWHGACFNLKTGDIEDFPGFDSLPCHQVTVTVKGDVKVRAKLSDLKSKKRVKEVSICTPCESNEIVIVGGGPSGATCAETLRSEGFTGRITLVAKENYLPYDRIKVSKIGAVTDIASLQARTEEYYNDTRIDIRKGVEATYVDSKLNMVHLSDGTKLNYTMLYLATGSKPLVPNIPGIDLKNIFTVRNFEDSVNILNTLGDNKDKHVVVLGMSFIGMEVAATCCEKAKSMTVVGTGSTPLGAVFGDEIGRRLRRLYEEKGVRFEVKTTIKECSGENGVLKRVKLGDEDIIPADVLILGIGTTFYTEFLNGSGINLEPNKAVTVNEKLETNIKNIYAGGDIAYAPVFAAGNQPMSIGHVGLSQYHGRIAALNMLKKETPLRTVPYFWTSVFGKSIRYAGCGKAHSTMVDGDIEALKFAIFFFDKNEKVIAMASCMRDPVVSQFAELLYTGKSLYKKDLKTDAFAWTNNIR